MRKPAQPRVDIDRTELAAGSIARSVRARLFAGIRKQDFDLVASALANDFSARIAYAGTPVTDGTFTLQLITPPQTPVGRDAFVKGVRERFSGFASIDRASFKVFSILVHTRDEFAWAEGHFSIAGVVEGRRAEFEGTMEVEALPQQDGTWLLSRLLLSEGTWTESDRTPFADVGPLTGFTLSDSAADAEHLQKTIDISATTLSGGLTVLDHNRDGFWDLIATRKDRGATLFTNDGKGGFTKSALFDDPREAARFYLWVDLDSDGTEELVSTRTETDGKGHVEIAVYKLVGGKATRLKGVLPFTAPKWMRDLEYEGVTACDVDGDDKLDLVFAGYKQWESLRADLNRVEGTDGLRNLLFVNKGRKRFEEVGMQRGLQHTQYTFVTQCHDFDEDGDVDLFFGNDYARNNYYVNDGRGQFTEDDKHALARSAGFTMGVSMADYDNTGLYSIALSNMYSHAGNRIVPLMKDLTPKMHEIVLGYAAGNALYEPTADSYEDNAKSKGVNVAEWAWGSTFADLDNDGDKDLYVVNGMTTNRDADAPDW